MVLQDFSGQAIAASCMGRWRGTGTLSKTQRGIVHRNNSIRFQNGPALQVQGPWRPHGPNPFPFGRARGKQRVRPF